MATRITPRQYIPVPTEGGIRPHTDAAQAAIDRVGIANFGKAYRPGSHTTTDYRRDRHGSCLDCGDMIRTGQVRCRPCNNEWMSEVMRARHAETRAA